MDKRKVNSVREASKQWWNGEKNWNWHKYEWRKKCLEWKFRNNTKKIITLKILDERYKLWSSSLWSLLHSPFISLGSKYSPNINNNYINNNIIIIIIIINYYYYIRKSTLLELTERNANHIFPSFCHLPVSCRSLVDQCDSCGRCKAQMYFIIYY